MSDDDGKGMSRSFLLCSVAKMDDDDVGDDDGAYWLFITPRVMIT